MNKYFKKKITGISLMISLLVSCNPKDKKPPEPDDGIPSEIHGNWQSSCQTLNYISSSQSYKIKINLSTYSAVVTREIYLNDSCTNYLGNLIYKYDVKRVDEESYDTNFIGASFKPGNDVTILNTHPNFCGLTPWEAGLEKDLWKKTCMISGAPKYFDNLKETIEIIPVDNEITVTFDFYDVIFTKF